MTGAPKSLHPYGMIGPEERYTDEKCDSLFVALFPNGLAGEDVLAEIAPEGWSRSTLRFVFHPTLDQAHHWESVQLHRNLQSWPLRDKSRPQEPEPTLEEVAAEHQDSPIEIDREARVNWSANVCGTFFLMNMTSLLWTAASCTLVRFEVPPDSLPSY